MASKRAYGYFVDSNHNNATLYAEYAPVKVQRLNPPSVPQYVAVVPNVPFAPAYVVPPQAAHTTVAWTQPAAQKTQQPDVKPGPAHHDARRRPTVRVSHPPPSVAAATSSHDVKPSVINRKDPLRAVLTNAKKAVASLPPERQLDPDEREVLDAEHGRGRTPVSSVSREWERMKVQRRNGVEEQLGKLDADRLDKSRSLVRMSQANPEAKKQMKAAQEHKLRLTDPLHCLQLKYKEKMGSRLTVKRSVDLATKISMQLADRPPRPVSCKEHPVPGSCPPR